MASDRSEIEESSHQYGLSDSEAASEQRRKRRRLNGTVSDDDTRAISDDGDLSFPSSPRIANEQPRDGGAQARKDDDKPKSRYKIHIPKYPDLPQDEFLTQVRERSSSPYRIGGFQWQKPRKLSPMLPSEAPATLLTRTPSNSISIPLKPANINAVNGRQIQLSTENLDNDSDDDYDNPFDDDMEDLTLDHAAAHVTANTTEPILVNSQTDDFSQQGQPQRLKAPLVNLKQTTLFGTQAQIAPGETQSNRQHNWPLANREEPPTHHKLNLTELNTWVYPTNLGTIRDYQYSIVAKGLYHNLLVALPTGLGKTFIAATVMLNWFRWTIDTQIVFVAPTKPLVSQQVKACFEIAGIPRSATSMLTGNTPPGLRAEEWNNKRVFFMTPQTIINDLKTGICDPKRLVLLVVDEAHRATGNYAYVEVVRFVRRFNSSFRVLALTATPGSSIETVQEVIDGLGISRVEIRTEESIDIRQYVHPRKIETILFDNSEEMVWVMDLFSKALQPVVNILNGKNAYWSKDPMSLTPFGCNQARVRWMSDVGKSASFGEKNVVNTVFSLLATLSHGSDLLKFHGIGPFYHKVLAWRQEIHAGGKKGSKYARQIDESEPFQTMMSRVETWINNKDFIGHPKLDYLQSIVMNHFLDAGEGRGASDPSGTRIMVFAHYRDSAEEIARILKRNEPMIRPHVFVGQANSKGSEGMDQKKQLEIIQSFKSGVYNTLVATSIGEEGLDIGEVDLIICYDASASPIRMLQRMGRTGRKRAGNIVVTLMKGKEENNFTKAKDNYEKMQVEIASGARFSFRDEESRRIVPKSIQPLVDKKVIDIPLENTQADLPEPSKSRRIPKRPPKKFHMPDGARKGFVKASRLDGETNDENESVEPTRTKSIITKSKTTPVTVTIPPLEEVLLTPDEEKTFERKYLNVRGDEPQIVELPRLDAYPDLQRSLRSTKYVAHSQLTGKVVSMLETMHGMIEDPSNHFENHLASEDRDAGTIQSEMRVRFLQASNQALTSPSMINIGASPFHSQSDLTIRATRRLSNESPAVSISSSIEGAPDKECSRDPAESLGAFPSTLSPCKTKGTETMMGMRESDEELPDFSDLVKRNLVSGSTAPGRARTQRRIVHDESDDE